MLSLAEAAPSSGTHRGNEPGALLEEHVGAGGNLGHLHWPLTGDSIQGPPGTYPSRACAQEQRKPPDFILKFIYVEHYSKYITLS